MGGDKISRTGMFFRLLFKSLRGRKNRVLIAFCSITTGAAVITALLGLYFDISIKMSRELRSYGANFFIGPEPGSGVNTIEQADVDEIIKEIPPERLIGATPYLYGIVRLDLGSAVLAGVDFPGLRRLSPYWQVEGFWVSVDFDEVNSMVGASLAKSMELKVGDRVTVMNTETGFQKTLTIKGIVETGQAEDEQIFVNLSLARKVLGIEGKVNHVLLGIVAEGVDVEALAQGLEKRYASIDARPIRKISQSEGRILAKVRGLMALVAAVMLSVTTLCVMATLMAIVSERRREIGLMKALGFENRGIVAQFLSETAVIACAGSLAGLFLGFMLAQVLGQAIFGSSISWRMTVVPWTFLVSLAAALAAAVMPLRTAVGVAPAQVLRGDE